MAVRSLDSVMRRAHSSRSWVRFSRRWATSSRSNAAVDSGLGWVESTLPFLSLSFRSFISGLATCPLRVGDPTGTGPPAPWSARRGGGAHLTGAPSRQVAGRTLRQAIPPQASGQGAPRLLEPWFVDKASFDLTQDPCRGGSATASP